ncbi:MAG: hypothetical protein EBY44_08150 [Actinobacteria bacterium]|nr:hypothetical protein [Actinomycetota bacterium]
MRRRDGTYTGSRRRLLAGPGLDSLHRWPRRLQCGRHRRIRSRRDSGRCAGRADGTIDHLESPWIDTVHVRGSGCTFAAATAAGLARGEDSVDAIRQAKAFVTDRLRASQWADLDGAGPVAHWISG